jgi:hypothetical protein
MLDFNDGADYIDDERETNTTTVPLDPVERDTKIDEALGRLHALEREVQRNNMIAERRIDPIVQWRDAENSRLENEKQFYLQRLQTLATGYDYGKKKSRNLPHGTFGLRQTGGGLAIVDQDAVIAFAEEHKIPVAVKRSVAVADLKEWSKSTGKIPAGCEVKPKVDNFYFDLAKLGIEE